MGLTITEKILSKAVGKEIVSPGEIVFSKLDGLMGHDQKVSAFKMFEEKLKKDNVFDPDKVWIIFDHHSPADTVNAAMQQKAMRYYVNKYKINHFFDIGQGGICHVVVPERGLVKPGDVIAGGDSHTCTYGALGAFSTGIGNTDFAYALAFGEIWLQVPASFKIICHGELPEYIGGKDIILKLLKLIGTDGATYKAIEFTGDTISSLPMSDRLTICNMVVEAGAKNGIIPPDEVTYSYLKKIKPISSQLKKHWNSFLSDPDAEYEKIIDMDCSKLTPQVACPDLPDNVVNVEELKNVKIDQVFIGSCTNGRIEDLRMAAKILQGKKINITTRLIIIPGSQSILKEALKEGIWDKFLEAGATLGPPACGPCPGSDLGLLAEGEVALSTSNRNFKGRMGHHRAEIYLSSPAVAAASALTGFITHPGEVEQ